jgi:hypothetical protein
VSNNHIFKAFLLLTPYVVLAQELRIPYIETPNITLDGRVTDSVYNEAYKIYSLNQILPVPGEPFPESTMVYIFQGNSGIYLGFHCETSGRKPDRSSLGDMVEIYIDTYLDKRSAYYFRVGANEDKTVARVTQDGENYDYDFETIWEARVHCRNSYYEVEIFIPWKGLMGKEGSWGMGIGRRLPNGTTGHLEFYDANQERFRISRLSETGYIHFKGREWVCELMPTVVLQHGSDYVDTFRYAPNIGCDVYLRARENFKLAFTYNPDFAEVEADPYQLNFTKYALFYGEKRPFFVEGKEHFSFTGKPSLDIFCSRQVGRTLSSGKRIPVEFGGKMFLKARKFESGALYARTKSVSDSVEYCGITDFVVGKMSLLLNRSLSLSAVNASRFSRKDALKSLFGVEGFYNNQKTQFIVQYVSDNYEIENWAMKSTISKQFGNMSLSQGYDYVSKNFSDEGIGHIPWRGSQGTWGNVTCNMFLNRRGIYRVSPFLYFSHNKELTEPFSTQGGTGLTIHFRNNFVTSVGSGYGREYEAGAFYYCPSYRFAILTDPSRYIYVQNWNIFQRIVGKHTLSTDLMHWIEVNPQDNSRTMTYSVSPNLYISIARRMYLSLYAIIPIKEGEIISSRFGMCFDWNPSGKSKLLSIYNYYGIRGEEPVLDKATGKGRFSLFL